jgi:hypothetical protein
MRSKLTFAFFLLLIPLLFFACRPDPDAGLRNISVDTRLVRADAMMYDCAKAIANDTAAEFMAIYQQYLQPERDYFYEFLGLEQLIQAQGGGSVSEGRKDSLIAFEMLGFLSDSMVFLLLDSVQKRFPSDYPLEEMISLPLKRLKKHFPDIELPAFRTHVSGYHPEGFQQSIDQTVPTPNYFSFGLHYFMGQDFAFYPPPIPAYIRRRFAPEYIPVMMAKEIASGMVVTPPPDQAGRLLDKIIQAGIRQYFMDVLLPGTPDSMKMLYSAKQMEWAEYFEANILKDLTPDLYSTDFLKQRDYLSEKPYTTELSMESAPRLGVFTGWKIVAAFMKRHPEVSLEELVSRTDYESILRESKYRP